jgi:putative heme-binding domain-containing protein
LGDHWASELERVFADPRAKLSDRLRAVDLMVFFGPPPKVDALIELARDRDPAMRAKVARLMGTQDEPALAKPLEAMLRDPDAWVRRMACEAVAHRSGDAPVDELVLLLADPDRYVAFAARKALEHVPAAAWQDKVLSATTARTFLQGGTGLLTAAPSRNVALAVLEGCKTMLRENIDQVGNQPSPTQEAEFRDTLRVIQLALVRGQISPEDVPGLTEQILQKYPTSDPLANRELVRLLTYLRPQQAAAALAEQLESNISAPDKLHIAAHAARLKSGWETSEKLAMLRYFESIRGADGGHSVNGYVENFARDFFTNLTLKERQQVIASGEKFPTSALSILAKLPPNPGRDVLAEMRALDERLTGLEGESIARLRVGLTAVLGASGEPESLAYLRDVYSHQPERRSPVAMSLTQHPAGENWDVLVDSLRTIDGIATPEVLTALTRVDRRPDIPEPYRHVILQGLRQTPSAGDLAVKLLEHWTGQATPAEAQTTADRLAAWQAWYAQQYPDALAAELPKDSADNKWSFEELAAFLEGDEAKAGNPSSGAHLFTTAQCIKCHRFNGTGESAGPDLTTLSQRFQRKEVLESIVFPSHVVSDQYASQMVSANGRTYTGIVARLADGSVMVLQSDGGKVTLAAAEIEEIEPSRESTMPEGLLNVLTLEQVADLFAFLMDGGNTSIAIRPPAAQR